jgi:HTH-type transcriptional regulator/antitoxin HigA
MNVRVVRNEADYAAALGRIDKLMSAEPDTPEGEELELLSILVEHYEQKNHAIEAPDPIEFLKNVMEFNGLGQSSLAIVLNSRSRASEILNRRRPLTLEQIRKISHAWKVPVDPLVQEYELNGVI